MEKKYGVSLEKLEEFLFLQQSYRKARKIAKMNGIHVILKSGAEEFNEVSLLNCTLKISENIEVHYSILNVRSHLILPSSEILAYQIVLSDLRIIIQFKPDFNYEQCILIFKNEQQLGTIQHLLPPIQAANYDLNR